MNLDHVAIATRTVTPALQTLVGSLGAVVERWGATDGFRAVQSRVGEDGMTVELIEPRAPGDDFLRRFLDERGEGLHHLTFDTDDLERDLRRLRDEGYEPVGVRLEAPVQRELFVSPAQAHGTVVQLVERVLPRDAFEHALAAGELPGAHEPWWDELGEPARPGATLRRVVLGADAPDEARTLFVELLGGQPVSVDRHTIDVTWPGGTVRLDTTPGTRRGLRRLECTALKAGAPLIVAGTTIVVDGEGEPHRGTEPRSAPPTDL